jgi:hypothetical protein
MKNWKQSAIIGFFAIGIIAAIALAACEKKTESSAGETAQAAAEASAGGTARAAAETPAVNQAEDATEMSAEDLAIKRIEESSGAWYVGSGLIDEVMYILTSEDFVDALPQRYQNAIDGLYDMVQPSPGAWDPRNLDLQIGAVVYMRYITYKFWAETNAYQDLVNKDSENAMTNKYNDILQFIISQGRVNRNDVISFYRENIWGYVYGVVADGCYYASNDGLIDTGSFSDRVSAADDIANFLVNPNENLIAILIGSNGKYFGNPANKIPMFRILDKVNLGRM